jgi:hypothetical protein
MILWPQLEMVCGCIRAPIKVVNNKEMVFDQHKNVMKHFIFFLRVEAEMMVKIKDT